MQAHNQQPIHENTHTSIYVCFNTSAVRCKHIISNPYRNGLPGHRILHVASCEQAGLVLLELRALQITLGAGLMMWICMCMHMTWFPFVVEYNHKYLERCAHVSKHAYKEGIWGWSLNMHVLQGYLCAMANVGQPYQGPVCIYVVPDEIGLLQECKRVFGWYTLLTARA